MILLCAWDRRRVLEGVKGGRAIKPVRGRGVYRYGRTRPVLRRLILFLLTVFATEFCAYGFAFFFCDKWRTVWCVRDRGAIFPSA